jgi:hypothetical protein
MATAGEIGAKPIRHSRSVMPATANRRSRGQLVSRSVQACRVRGSTPVARIGRVRAPSSGTGRFFGFPDIGRLQRLERGIFFGMRWRACSSQRSR